MRVLVTGAAGFVGRKLMPRLEDAGHVAIGTDREVDITNPAAVAAALRASSPDAVIHLAAMSSVAESWRDPELCHQINVGGTRTVLAAIEAICPSARVLLVGSADAYGTTRPDEAPGFRESMPLRPHSPYAKSKVAAEVLGEAAAARGLDVIRIRAFNHTGRGQSDVFVVSSFARQVAEIRCGMRAPLLRVGNLESVRDFLHVDDVLEAYLALLDPGVPADVYNIASERATSIQEVLDQLISIAGIEPRIEIDPDRWRPTDWSVGDASKLRDATGWRPRIPLQSILREVYDDWLEKSGRG